MLQVKFAEDTFLATLLAQTQSEPQTLILNWGLAFRKLDADGKGQAGCLTVPPRNIDLLAKSKKPDEDLLLRFDLLKKEAVRQSISTEHRLLDQFSQTLLQWHDYFRWALDNACATPVKTTTQMRDNSMADLSVLVQTVFEQRGLHLCGLSLQTPGLV